MIFAERYKARRYAEGVAEGRSTGRAEGRAEGRSTGLAEGRLEAVEVAIRRRTREIDPGVEVTTDDSQWFDREVMRVTLTKSGRKNERVRDHHGAGAFSGSPSHAGMATWFTRLDLMTLPIRPGSAHDGGEMRCQDTSLHPCVYLGTLSLES